MLRGVGGDGFLDPRRQILGRRRAEEPRARGGRTDELVRFGDVVEWCPLAVPCRRRLDRRPAGRHGQRVPVGLRGERGRAAEDSAATVGSGVAAAVRRGRWHRRTASATAEAATRPPRSATTRAGSCPTVQPLRLSRQEGCGANDDGPGHVGAPHGSSRCQLGGQTIRPSTACSVIGGLAEFPVDRVDGAAERLGAERGDLGPEQRGPIRRPDEPRGLGTEDGRPPASVRSCGSW